jgi:hypothetical protein
MRPREGTASPSPMHESPVTERVEPSDSQADVFKSLKRKYF